MTRQVEWRDLDTAQHVNNAVYLHYTEECAIRAAVARGWPPGRMLREGFAIVAREQTIEYTGQARLGDVLRVTTYLADVRRISAVRHFSIVREDGTPIARARGLFLFADLAKGAIVRVPAHFAADFADQVAQA
jgi:acyl-CoA thioester hydrolase